MDWTYLIGVKGFYLNELQLYFKNIYLERRGGVQLLLGALDEDGAVREGEAQAPDVGVTERLPAVSLVGDDFHGLECGVKPLTKEKQMCVVKQNG